MESRKLILLLLGTVISLTLSETEFPKQCTLENGKCIYHIQMTEACSPPKVTTSSSLEGYQSDEATNQVNEIQKNVDKMKKDHSKKIKDLENTLFTLVHGSVETIPKSNRSKGVDTKDDVDDFVEEYLNLISANQQLNLPGDPALRETHLLSLLHKEFSGIRHELADTKWKLEEMEKMLKTNKRKLNRTTTILVQTTEKLMNTENTLRKSQDENTVLKSDIAAKDDQLEKLKTQLKEAQEEATQKEQEVWKAREESEKLRQELRDLNFLLSTTRRLLAEALRKYHRLNVKHDTTVKELVNKTEALVNCFKGKIALHCGFEDKNICGYEQDNSTDWLDWIRLSGPTPSSKTGPTADHTCASKRGHYMYVEASTKAEGHNAILLSPKYHGLGPYCVEFYYHMFGHHIGTLNVYTKVVGEFIPTWRAYGNQGNVWTKARIQITAEVAFRGYQIVFEAILDRGYQGDLAIDDVRVFEGSCIEMNTADNSTLALNSTELFNTTTLPDS